MKNRKEQQSLGRKDFPFILHPSSFILLTAALLLSSCGFQLRGQVSLPFDSLYVSGPSLFVNQVARAVRSGSQTRITSNPGEAQVRLEILGERRERAILSLSSSGRAREITLTYRVSYRVFDRKKSEYIQTSEILLKRDLSYTDTDVIAKEQEEALLYHDMQNDAIQQLVRRLQTARIDS